MTKHRDHGVAQPKPFAYVDKTGNLWRIGYMPHGRVLRPEYGLPYRAVAHGEPFGTGDE